MPRGWDLRGAELGPACCVPCPAADNDGVDTGCPGPWSVQGPRGGGDGPRWDPCASAWPRPLSEVSVTPRPSPSDAPAVLRPLSSLAHPSASRSGTTHSDRTPAPPLGTVPPGRNGARVPRVIEAFSKHVLSRRAGLQRRGVFNPLCLQVITLIRDGEWSVRSITLRLDAKRWGVGQLCPISGQSGVPVQFARRHVLSDRRSLVSIHAASTQPGGA